MHSCTLTIVLLRTEKFRKMYVYTIDRREREKYSAKHFDRKLSKCYYVQFYTEMNAVH